MPRKPLTDEEVERRMEQMRVDYEHDNYQRCSECGEEKHLNPDFWHRDKEKASGFKTVCKGCRNKNKQEDVDRKVVERTGDILREKAEAIEHKAITFLDIATQSDVERGAPHIAEIYEQIMHVFQGPEGVARMYLATFLQAPEGGSVRQRILDKIMATGQKVSEMGVAQVPTELLSDEELEKAIDVRLKRMSTAHLLVDSTDEEAA